MDLPDILKLALDARKRRNDATACELFSIMHLANPENQRYQYFYGDSLRLLARHAQAEKQLLASYRHENANHFLVSIALARLCETTGRLSEAEGWLRVATECKPDDTIPWVYLGNFLYKQARSREAIEALKHGIVANGPLDEVHTCIALCYRSLAEYRAARESCIDALRYDPSNEPAKELLVDLDGVIGVTSKE